MNAQEQAKYDKVVAMLREVAESSTTEYRGEEDEIGACIHCYELSFRGHADHCLILRVKKLLAEVEG